MTLHNVVIDSVVAAPPQVLIDGELQPPARRISLDWKAADVAPKLFLEFDGVGEFHGQAEVHVTKPAALAGLLDKLDPQALEAEALAILGDPDGPETTGEAFCEAFRRWAGRVS